MLDADERAILFLCCENHPVSCAACGRERRIGSLRKRRSDPERWLCPKCRTDVTPGVVAHTRVCRYFLGRKGLARIAAAPPPAATA